MNVVCFSDVAWNFIWQRQHHLISRFPAGWKILYVEPSFWKACILKIINFFSQIKAPKNSNILVTSIPTVPLFEISKITRKINDKIILHCMQSLVRSHNLDNFLLALIIYNPRFSCVVGRLGECLSCYDIIDDKLEFKAIPRWLEIHHKFLIDNVNMITVSSAVLLKEIQKHRTNDVFLIGNGVETSHFKKALLDKQMIIPNDIRHIKYPIVGYIGSIGEWFDFNLLEDILRIYPDVSVLLIGWVFTKQRPLLKKLQRNYKNLYFLGRRSYSMLPYYVRAFTVCIIPFRVYKLTQAVNPIKLYEYLAAGKPVVSMSLSELYNYKDVIYLANDYKEFLEFIQIAIHDKHETEKFLEIAYKNDWQYKVAQMIELIVKYCSKH